MKQFTTIKVTEDKNVATVWLNKPAVHNAFDEMMVNELTEVFHQLDKDDQTRVVVLRGEGKSFSAGADLNEMRNSAKASYEQNLQNAQQLATCFQAIYTCTKPTIALVHGAAFGGANGLLASCDVALAENQTSFSFSEVNIGLIPAVISPYVIKRIGEFPAKELMLTGMKFTATTACDLRLVSKIGTLEELEEQLNHYIKLFLTSGPKAMSLCKQLITRVAQQDFSSTLIDFTAQQIAAIRVSEEGQEGLNAFLEKRKPNWKV